MKDLMDEIQDVLDMVVNCLDKGEYAIENKNIQKIISRNLFSNIKNIDRILNWYPGPIMAYSDKCLELTDGLFKNTYVNKRKAQELIKYGCTLEFDFINMYDMKINRYVNAVSRIIGLAPNAHKKVVSYYSVKGGGLPIHFDAYSNIIMQVDGYKTWRLSRNNSVLLPLEHYELNDSYKGSDELQSYWGGGYSS